MMESGETVSEFLLMRFTRGFKRISLKGSSAKIYICFFLLCNSLFVFSQEKYNVWTRFTLNSPLSKNIQADWELMHRRQNDAGQVNPLSETLTNATRISFTYQFNPNFSATFSPFAYFENHRIIVKENDRNAAPRKEIRFSAFTNNSKSISKDFNLLLRNGIEYRINLSDENQVRLRHRAGIAYQLNENSKLILYDELLYHLKNANSNTTIDHNRIILDFENKWSKSIKINAGYMYISRNTNTSDNLHEHNFMLTLTYRIPIKNNAKL